VTEDEDPNDAWHAKPGPSDPALVHTVLTAARANRPESALEAVVVAAFEAGVTPVGMMRACYAAQDLIDDGDRAEDAVIDLMDRLAGWCHPDAHLTPLPRK
jgi:hypothetical protein